MFTKRNCSRKVQMALWYISVGVGRGHGFFGFRDFLAAISRAFWKLYVSHVTVQPVPSAVEAALTHVLHDKDEAAGKSLGNE